MALVAGVGLGAEGAHAEAAITWRVENPFRFFQDPADSEVHRATYLALSPQEREHPVLSAEQALSGRHQDGWAATMFRKTCWDAAHSRYRCPDATDYVNPASHDVIAQIVGIEEGEAVDCLWQSLPLGTKGARAKKSVSVKQSCREDFNVEVPYPGGARISVEIGGRVVAESDIRVDDVFIVGMGDSFGSGEGNPDLPVRFSRERTADYDKKELIGYPARVGPWKTIGDADFIAENARWLDQACHRSLYSYQVRTALQLAVEDPHRAVTYVGEACSGAEVTAGLFLRYKGNEWVPSPPDLSQISAVARESCGKHEAAPQDLPEAYHMNGQIPDLQGGLVLRKCDPDVARRIDLILLSIGGNDIGFSRLVANAVLADQSLLKKLGGWFGEVHGPAEAARQLHALNARYKSFSRALHNVLHLPWDQNDRVVLTAYPALALLGDGNTVCPDGRAGMEVLKDFQLSESKARDGERMADKLNATMKSNASEHGWSFADVHRQQFVGRGLCAGYTDNAFSNADDLRLPRRTESGWVPYNPADYAPYATRQRWFRTPNDAFLTGNFHVSGSILQKALKLESLSWFQILLASTYSGAFHPTAEGHAAIADAVLPKARAVLEKYGRGRTVAQER